MEARRRTAVSMESRRRSAHHAPQPAAPLPMMSTTLSRERMAERGRTACRRASVSAQTCRPRTDVRTSWSPCLPAVLAEKRHEPNRCDFDLLKLISAPREHMQHLLVEISEGNEDSSAFGELLKVCLGKLRRPGTNENRVVWRVLSPAEGTVSKKEGHVPQSDLLNDFPGAVEERLNSLDGKDLGREPRQQSRLVSRAGPDL